MTTSPGVHARPFLRPLHVLLIILMVLPPIPVLGQSSPDNLAKAEEFYNRGQFEDSVKLLEDCLGTNPQPELKSKVYRLIGLNYVGMDLRDKAHTAIEALLTLVPDYEPDPKKDRPEYVRMVYDIRKEKDPSYVPPAPVAETAKKGHGWLTKILIGAGAAVAAVLAFGGGGGGGDNGGGPSGGDLPPPPTLP